MAFAQRHGAASTLAAAGTYPWTADDQCCTAAGCFSLVVECFLLINGDSSWGDFQLLDFFDQSYTLNQTRWIYALIKLCCGCLRIGEGTSRSFTPGNSMEPTHYPVISCWFYLWIPESDPLILTRPFITFHRYFKGTDEFQRDDRCQDR